MPRRLLAFVFSVSGLLLAQTPTASVTGQIKDPSGSAVSGAKVTARNLGTNSQRTALSNDAGQYVIPLLQPGSYELVFESPGFKQSAQTGIVLQVGQEARIDARLDMGQVSEVVEVKADALQTATETASTGTVIENRKVVELPLNSREFYGLALRVPGAYQPAQNSTLGFRGGFNVAGSNETNNNFTVNGIDNNDSAVNAPSFRPSVDSIQEFKLLTGIYPAEYGRSSGGQVVVITKSGTNQWHGGVFEFLRNQVVDAKNYFTPAGADPVFKRNQFGGTFGGPIRRDKTFFFFNYEGLRLRQQVSQLGTVPLPEMLSGDFRYLLTAAKPVHVLNPFTGRDFSTPNLINPSLISPLGKAIAGFFPAPNRPTAAGALPASNFNLNGTRRETMNEYSLKIDHTLSEKDSLYGNYNHFDDPSFEPSNSLCGSSVLPGFGCNVGLRTQLAALVETHIFNPGLINEARFGLNRLIQPRVQEDVKATVPGLPNVFFETDPNNTGVPNTAVTGYSTLGGATNLPQNRSDLTTQFVDNVSWTKGRHALKFGFEMRRFQGNSYYVQNGRGVLSFTGSASALTSGYPLADLLLGLPTSTSRNPVAPSIYHRLHAFDTYVQDDYKLTSTLTLNLGLRWEYNSPLSTKDQKLSSFDPTTGGLRITGQGGVGSTLYDSSYKNFAPRAGFAWQPFHNALTVVRGEYGVFYNQTTTFNGVLNLALNAPFRNPQTFNSNKITPVTLTDPFPAADAGGSITATGISKKYPTAYAQQWSFGIQRQITQNLLADVSYFGSKGTDLPTSRNLNQPLPGLGTTAQVNARRPYPSYGTITYLEDDGNSSFQSLQAKLEKRFSYGVSFLVSYTLGKSIDDSPGIASTSAASKLTAQNSYNLRAERGLSDFDVRQRLVWSPIWNIPFGKTGNHMLNVLAAGWQVSGIFSAQSGRPLTPYYSANISNTFTNSDRPNVVGDPNSGPHTPSQWFNVAAFAQPAIGMFGNTGRGIIHGPGLVNVDFSLSRIFAIRERMQLQFRAETFNLANHPNFNYPNATADNPSFRQIASAGDPRQIQFGLKLNF